MVKDGVGAGRAIPVGGALMKEDSPGMEGEVGGNEVRLGGAAGVGPNGGAGEELAWSEGHHTTAIPEGRAWGSRNES